MNSAEWTGGLFVLAAALAVLLIGMWIRKRYYKEAWLGECRNNRLGLLNLKAREDRIKQLEKELEEAVIQDGEIIARLESQIHDLRKALDLEPGKPEQSDISHERRFYEHRLKHYLEELNKIKEELAYLRTENRELKEELKLQIDIRCAQFDEYSWYRMMVQSGFPEIYRQIERRREQQQLEAAQHLEEAGHMTRRVWAAVNRVCSTGQPAEYELTNEQEREEL